MNRTATIVFCLITWGCAEAAPPATVPLNVYVFNENRDPVEGASIFVDGQNLGRTNQSGRFTRLMEGPEHRVAEVTARCPEGMVESGAKIRAVTVRFLRPLAHSEQGNGFTPLEALFTCSRPTRKHVVLVRTNLNALFPITMLGNTVAQTNAQGVAQFVIEGLPGEEVEVTLDTSDRPDLRPASPTRRFKIPKTSQLIVFDQVLETGIKKETKRKRRRRGPRRI